MDGTHLWMDVIEEVQGSKDEIGPSPSPWDALSIVSKVADGERPRIVPRDVDLSTSLGGGEDALRLDLPLVMTDNSEGQLSPHARLALIQAAARTGCALRMADPTPEYVELARELGVALWVVMAPHRTASTVRALDGAAVVELQLVALGPDGGIATSVDAWDGEGSLGPAIEALRSVSAGAAVYVNVGTASDRTTVRSAMVSGADGVVVQARSRRSSLSPRQAGTSPMAAVASMRRQAAWTNRSAVPPIPRHVVSGGFKDGTEVAKALALGADLVMLGTAPRIALGCTLCGECGAGECPKRAPGHDPVGKGDKGDWKAEAHQLVEYIERVAVQVRVALAQMGCSTAGAARPDRLETVDYDVAAVTGVVLSGYGEELPMWRH